MCGIAGAISKIDISSERINQTLGLMKNRGPDGSRSEVIIFNNHKIFLQQSYHQTTPLNDLINHLLYKYYYHYMYIIINI